MLRLRTLGTVGVEGELSPSAGGRLQRRPLALLSALAVAGDTGLSRHSLIALFWSESDEERARNVLRQLVHAVRRDTGIPDIILGTTELRLNPALISSDVNDFARHLERDALDAALDVYGGPFLDGFYLSNAAAFERWKEQERARLERLFATSAERLARRAVEQGAHERAIELWRRLAVTEPLNSRYATELVRSLAAAGDPGGALAHARAHETLLREELGTAPTNELVRVVDGLREHAQRRGTASIEEPRPGERAPEISETRPVHGAGLSGGGTLPGIDASTDGPRVLRASSTPGARSRLLAYVVLPIVALATAMSGWFLARIGERPATASSLDPRQIAVLPFDDNSPEGRLNWLANGLAMDLIDALSGSVALSVRSPEAVRPYRSQGMTLDSLAQALSVGTVVSGTIDLIGDSLRISVRVTDARTGTSAGPAIRVTGTLRSIERTRTSVIDSVSQSLRGVLGDYLVLSRRQREAGNAEAWELVQRADEMRLDAVASWARRDARSARERLDLAEGQLQRAQELAPKWAEPLVLLGWIAEARAGMEAEQPSDRCTAACVRWRREAISHASKALEIDRDDVEALELRGTVRSLLVSADLDVESARDALEGAEEDLRRAIATDSARARAWLSLGRVYRAKGDLARANATTARAARSDPWLQEARTAVNTQLIDALQRGEREQASRLCDLGVRLYPGERAFLECRLSILGWLGTTRAEADSAMREFRRIESMMHPPMPDHTRGYRRAVLGAVLARTGDSASSRQVLRLAEQELPPGDPNWPMQRAWVELLLGDTTTALGLLREYASVRPQNRSRVAASPWLAPLRRNIRFIALVRGAS